MILNLCQTMLCITYNIYTNDETPRLGPERALIGIAEKSEDLRSSFTTTYPTESTGESAPSCS
jgi:hypothetical protein